MPNSIKDAVAKHWRLLLAQGILVTLLGVLAIAAPMVATVAVELLIGWLFIVAGVAGLIAIFSSHDIHAFVWSIVTAALSVVIGILLVWHPAAGAASLTILLTTFFFVEGIFQTAASLAYRQVLGGTWGYLLLSGITDLVLALIIVLGLPMSASWTIGIIVGINLLTSGYAILTVAFAGRRIAKEIGQAHA